MKKSERILLSITIILGIAALLYVYLLEPHVKPLFKSASIDLRNKEYLSLLNRKTEIKQQAAKVLSAKYWETSPQGQQIVFQMYLEGLIKDSGIAQTKSINPITSESNGNSSKEIALQVDIESSISSLTRLLYAVGKSDIPLQVRKLQISGETSDQNIIRAQIEIATIWIETTVTDKQ